MFVIIASKTNQQILVTSYCSFSPIGLNNGPGLSCITAALSKYLDQLIVFQITK